ncbi:hypothetical protein BIY24_14730 [Halobacteriovorax marinus]|uniref:hypothetical protein n=1 Tax=Halobacteriovorax marinus TaxID=97084 RepID=UPI000BC31147|nr:hypothetical protein [Halobacteriovorax marinus]ATH09152.1 hypothetical protein BIY24_14730 [Halobacteriovorax marinus]
MKTIVLFLINIQLIHGSSSYKVDFRTLDKFYIYNFLLSTFGPHNKEILKKNILSRPEVFAGGCLPYKVSIYRKDNSEEVENDEDRCINHPDEIGDPSFAPITSIRQSLIESACIEILGNEKSFTYFGKKLGFELNQKPSIENLNKVVDIFFYKKSVASRYQSTFITLDKISWKTVLLTLCKSPEWQVL